MELRHLRYFIAVAEHLNFSRAAEELVTAQPSLSQQIRALEDELKMSLFERTRRYVALTAEGRLLLPEARAIVQRVEALTTLSEISSDPRGPLRIASLTASTIGVLPQVVPSYRRAYPNVQVFVETWTLEEDLRALLERRVDVAFTRAPLNDPRLEVVPIAEEQICIALPNGHPLGARKKVPFRALNGLDFIRMRDAYTGDFNKTTALELSRHGVVERSVLETGNVETMLGLVACGMGVAVVSAIVKLMLVSGMTIRPLEPRRSLKNLSLAWRRDRAELPIIRSFRDHVVNAGLVFRSETPRRG
jgi:DNA-binding transcriptional LysR family regulator